ncbi:exonuclease 1 [Canna indica]|uniref:Exonuclease 1 n=1 Tax=Canna indica TaxID=4628 RepID=A0AAQ3KA19_9LILI|nr:exonuclease 1 [Canna indica]
MPMLGARLSSLNEKELLLGRRETNLELAKEKLKQGNAIAAIEFFQKAIHITPSMAHKLIQIFRSECVEFIVAPYEADAQLAYLSSLEPDQGGIAAVITEDSDLIAYGCQAIIFKMDRYGNGEEIMTERIFNTISDGLSFKDFDKELLTGMCVLAGCDFLPSVPGIGVKRAYSLVSKYKNLDRVLSVLKSDKRYKMPEDYCDSFRKAVAVFHHARVYDAVTQELKHLKPLEGENREFLNGDMNLLGPELPQPVAAAIAEGNLNPITMEEFELEMCSKTASIPSFENASRHESRTSFTEESCITMFSAEQNLEEITTDLDKKYIREASALGKLVSPMETHQVVVELAVDSTIVPDNNPFKKRKIKSSPKKAHFNTEPLVAPIEDSPGIVFCSPPESQESVQSKPKKVTLVGKDRIQKKPKAKNEKESLSTEKNGILKFFQRL